MSEISEVPQEELPQGAVRGFRHACHVCYRSNEMYLTLSGLTTEELIVQLRAAPPSWNKCKWCGKVSGMVEELCGFLEKEAEPEPESPPKEAQVTRRRAKVAV